MTGLVRRARGLEYKWVVLVNTTIAVLITSLDTSVLNVSTPYMMRSLSASVVEIMWVMTGYTLVITVLLLPLARLSDMKGRVRMYNVGFALFTAASALCGFSQTGTQLVLARLLQGVGASLLYANNTALLTDAFPVRQRGFALGINMSTSVVGMIMGTVLGGIVTELLGWRYIFFLNIPFGTFATVWALLRLHEIIEPDRKARFDVGGMVTFPLGIGSLLGALTLVVLGQWGEPLTNTLFVLGIGLLIIFLFIERWAAEPMMDLGLFRIRTFWAGNVSLLLIQLARGSNVFILSWYFQAVLNDSPLMAGVKTMPLAARMMLVSPFAGRLADRFGTRWPSTLGTIAICIGQLWIVMLPVSVPYVILALPLVLLGLGNGLFSSPNTSSLMSAVPVQRRCVANGTRALLFNSGQTMALAMAMAILSTVMSYKDLTALFSGSATAAQALDSVSFMNGLHDVYLVGAALSFGAIICSSLRGTDVAQPPSAVVKAVEVEPRMEVVGGK